MQRKISFFQDDFAKPEFGHYFCPFFSFPKKSWKKKYTDLYNKWSNLLKEKRNVCPLIFLKYYKIYSTLIHSAVIIRFLSCTDDT